jgi:predicted ATPase/DNA-binding SARP family transcriptional activator
VSQFKLYLFGPPRLERNGQPVEIKLRKALALLVYLATTRQPHSREALATLFWPEHNQRSALANLRRLLYDLNQLVGEQVLDTAADAIRLRTGIDVWVDAQHFQALLAEASSDKGAQGAPRWQGDQVTGIATGRAITQSPSHPVTQSRLAEAATLYKDDFLAGFTLPDCPSFDDWQFFQREELRRLFASLMAQLTTLHEAGEALDEALHYARRWLALDPLDEAVHRRLMQLFVLSGQSAAAIRQYDECVRILKRELDVPPEAETTALYEAIRTKRFPPPGKVTRGPKGRPGDKVTGRWGEHPITQPPSHPVTLSPPHNLPVQTTPFVGRKHEIADLIRSLSDPNCRLLTLVGPGGIGKTRLAVEVAQAMIDSKEDGSTDNPKSKIQNLMYGSTDDPKSKIQNLKFSDGVFFVALQPVSAPSGLVPTISAALGLQFYEGAPPQDQLLNFLREKQVLLVLDNFEHLLPGAGLVVEILAAAPGTKMLVTSREALKLAEEWFHPLAGMRLPQAFPPTEEVTRGPKGRPDDKVTELSNHPITQSPSHPVTAASDAVELFIQTARRAQVGFEPEAHYTDIVRICRLVDGMPLAIVLAASWLKVLSSAQIAIEIEQNMDILVTRYQNVPERHRSMRAVLEHSWRLLSEDAQQVLKRMSVFQGSFVQDAAATIAGATFTTLSELVEKAWLYLTPDERYQLHELLRQFAAEELAANASDTAETRDRHAEYYLRQVARRERALKGPEQRAALSEIDLELENARAAWFWAADQGYVQQIDGALHGFYLYFHTRGRYAEGQEIFAHALQLLDRPIASGDAVEVERVRGRLLARQAGCQIMLGELDAAEGGLDTALNQTEDRRERTFIYFMHGRATRVRSNRPAAEAAFRQSLRLSRERDDQNDMAEALLGLSDMAASFGDWAEAHRLAVEALAICRRLHRPDLNARVLAAMAWATNSLGGYAESARYYSESLSIFEAIGDPQGVALATSFLGWVAFCEGGSRLAEALSFYRQAMTIWRQIGHRVNLGMSLGDYALAACELGDYATALDCGQEGLAIMEELHHFDLMAYNLCGMGAAACGMGDLQAGRQYLLRALKLAHGAQIFPQASLAVYFLSQLLVTESQDAGLSASQRLETQANAARLLAWVIHRPTTWQLFRDRAQQLLAELAESLPADTMAAAQQRGREQTLEGVATELLGASSLAAMPFGS